MGDRTGIDRRSMLLGTGAALATGLVASAKPAHAAATGAFDPSSWESVRQQFELSADAVHLSALLIAAHPRAVRERIEEYRRGLDRDPVTYLMSNNGKRRRETLAAAAKYLGGQRSEVALTDSTTMGLGIVYGGLLFEPGQEVLSTEHDYYVTHEALRMATASSGARVRQVALYPEAEAASEEKILERIGEALQPRTRVVALTWVHSGTGAKLPLRGIVKRVRDYEKAHGLDRILVCVDGVHGFGVEDEEVASLGVDFFIAGCHKWLFGPRGTGIVWARADAWERLQASIPSFIEHRLWRAWRDDVDPNFSTTAAAMTPGGFKAYEHRWALAEAFAFHDQIGRKRIATRTHELASQCREALSTMKGIRLRTPMSDALSSGIVCFDVNGMTPYQAVRKLRARQIIATVTPYATRHVRIAPSVYNSSQDVERGLRAIREL